MRIVGSLLAVLLVFCTLFFGVLIRSRSHGKRFTALHAGQSQTAVEAQVGPATRTMACRALPEPPQDCSTVLVYQGPLAAVMPEFWLIPLDSTAHVLRVLHTTRAD